MHTWLVFQLDKQCDFWDWEGDVTATGVGSEKIALRSNLFVVLVIPGSGTTGGNSVIKILHRFA
jgi:hypothetical protein